MNTHFEPRNNISKDIKQQRLTSLFTGRAGCVWVMQLDKDLKHTSKSISQWLKRNKIKVLAWLASHLKTLNDQFTLEKPPSVAKLKQFCKDAWAKIPPQWCKRLIASYCDVVTAKVWHNQLWFRGGNYFFTWAIYVLNKSLSSINGTIV